MTVEWGQVLAYAVVVFIGAVAPGADFAIVSRYASLNGRAAGLAAAAGIAGGLAVNATAALLGLAAVLLASPLLYAAIRAAGALYLLYLGITILWSLRPGPSAASGGDEAGAAPSPPTTGTDGRLQPEGVGVVEVTRAPSAVWKAFRQALFTNLLNPKPIIFLVTLMPQFLPVDPDVASRAVLGAVTVVAAFAWFAIVALVFSAFARLFAIPRVAFGVSLVTGLMLLSIGIGFLIGSIADLVPLLRP